MRNNKIVFEERHDNEVCGTTTLYFTAPKEMLKLYVPNNEYPEAISMEISIEFPAECTDPASCADVCVSPTREVEGGTEDYDWCDIYLPSAEIEELIKLANL